MVVGIDASRVLLADDGLVVVDAGRNASLVMDEAPSNPASSTVKPVGIKLSGAPRDALD